jgi:ribosomal protein S18 acetylase RimI-like enzyme
MEIFPYEPHHLDAVLTLCRAEGWTTLSANRDRAARALGAPGVTALVALEGDAPAGRLLGFSQAVGDGAITAYLCMLLVAADARGRGVGRALAERTLRDSGALRLDVLSSADAVSLYERFPHNAMPGFRLYPDGGLTPGR